MTKDIEKFSAIIARAWDKAVELRIPSLPGTNCVAESTLEDYLAKTASQETIQKLESHLGVCQVCLDRLMILRNFKNEKLVDVPNKQLQSIKDLVHETRPNCLELILGFSKKVIHIIHNTGTLLTPCPLVESFRGENHSSVVEATDFVGIKKRFDKINVEVQIERINGSYKLMVNTLDVDSLEPPSHIKLLLMSMDRELNSIDDSEAVFYIKLKKYIIKILQNDSELGNISLDLRQE